MTDAHAAAIAWVAKALAEELPDLNEEAITKRAQDLTAIAAAEGTPIELLIEWIHTPSPGKRWSPGEWRRWSALFKPTFRI